LTSLSIKPGVVTSVSSTIHAKVSGKNVVFGENSYGIQGVGFNFVNDAFELSIKRDNVNYSIKAGKDVWKLSNTGLTSILSAPRIGSKSIDANYKILRPVIRPAAVYTWTDNNTLELTARFVEESLGSEGIIFRFLEEGGNITVSLSRKGGRGTAMGQGGQVAPAVLTGRIVSN
jgi:hypothetical protein